MFLQECLIVPDNLNFGFLLNQMVFTRIYVNFIGFDGINEIINLEEEVISYSRFFETEYRKIFLMVDKELTVVALNRNNLRALIVNCIYAYRPSPNEHQQVSMIFSKVSRKARRSIWLNQRLSSTVLSALRARTIMPISQALMSASSPLASRASRA